MISVRLADPSRTPMSKVDEEILKSFYENPETFLSGEDIARQLGLSRTAIWSHIQELKEAGLPIEAVPNLGYRLAGQSTRLIAADIKARLQTRIIGREVLVFRQTDSTQALVEQLARDQAAEGLVVFAESQKKGRGRLGRKWVSPAGTGLWFSILLRPQWRPDEVTRLTVMAAVAVARVLETETGLDVDIKYPNDLMIHGKKICGILTEMKTEVDLVQYAILGIGVNVNATTQDFPAEAGPAASSLRIEAGRSFGRPELAAKILETLDDGYHQIRTGHFVKISEEWSERCTTLGKRITVDCGKRKISGMAYAIDDDGSLLVKTASGAVETLRGGDIIMEKK